MPPGPPKLTAHHSDTLRQIFAHPLSHNVEWHAVVSLLHEIGQVDEREEGRLAVTAGDRTVVLARPRHRDLGAEELVELRHFLESVGYGAAEG